MGYRGSKSGEPNEASGSRYPVKEQRVDGSLCSKGYIANRLHIRCTLMGLERDYQVKILSRLPCASVRIPL